MLGYLLILGALILGLAAGYDLPQIATYFLQGLLEGGTLQLLGVITLIEMLTIFLELTGSLQRILASLRRIFENSGVLIALVPSLLGLFPVPGGAMLSAPMVGIYGDEIGFKANRKSTINLFFRHIWDQVFPFKPHLILAATVVDIPLFTLIGWNLPVTLASVLVGFWYLIGRDPRLKSLLPTNHEDPPRGRPLWVEVAPLMIPLVLALGFRIDFVYAMATGLLFGLLTQKVSGSMLKKMVLKGIRPQLLFILAAVMIFKTLLENSGLIKILAHLLPGYGIPVGILAFALPLVISFATGMELVAVGMVYPLLLGLIPPGTLALPYIIIMMTANAIGQTHSPVHICMVVGNEYFGASLRRVIWMSLIPQGFRLAAALLFAWALAIFLPR
jgi:integral membrane protein (TIGR00529 family)